MDTLSWHVGKSYSPKTFGDANAANVDVLEQKVQNEKCQDRHMQLTAYVMR